MRNNVYTVAVLPAKSESVEELLTLLQTLAEATRLEDGCIEYGFYQVQEENSCVISFERWVDQASEDAHWQTTHLKQALTGMDRLLIAKPQIYKTKKVI